MQKRANRADNGANPVGPVLFLLILDIFMLNLDVFTLMLFVFIPAYSRRFSAKRFFAF